MRTYCTGKRRDERSRGALREQRAAERQRQAAQFAHTVQLMGVFVRRSILVYSALMRASRPIVSPGQVG